MFLEPVPERARATVEGVREYPLRREGGVERPRQQLLSQSDLAREAHWHRNARLGATMLTLRPFLRQIEGAIDVELPRFGGQ